MSTVYEDVQVADYVPNSGPTTGDKVVLDSRGRWFFNPAAKINVRDRVTGNEIDADGNVHARTFIKPGVLVPFRNVTYNVPRPKDQPPAPGSKPEQQRLLTVTKYASEIADEIAFAYADTGATVIESLTGIEDEGLVRSIYRLCMGTQLKVATDPALPGEKIPVVPAMVEYLSFTAPTNIERAFEGKNSKEDRELRATIEATRSELLASCNAAIAGWARFTVEESKQSIADRSGGHPGKAKFDVRDHRVFAALGETIPTNIQPTNPTLEKAVEILLNKELNKPEEDPRIAMLEKALAEQKEMIEGLMARKPKGGPGASAGNS